MIASTLTVFGAGVAAAWKFAGLAVHADGVSAALDAPAQALAPAVRIQRPNRLSFAVQLPGDIVVLDNFGGRRLFGGEPHQGNAWMLQAGDGFGYRHHHLADFEPGPSVGDAVTRSQVIGTMGSTGNPSSPHLHFEVRRGRPIGTPVDPFRLLALPLPVVAVI